MGLKTTTKRIVGTLIILAGTSAGIAPSVPCLGLFPTCLVMAATGDDGPTDIQKADDLLRQARKAMAEHNRLLADSFISRAEEINPKYGLFHTGDTPKKCRADYNRSLGLNPDGTSTSAIPPVSVGKAQDPFLGRNNAPPQFASADAAYVGSGGSPNGFSSVAAAAPNTTAAATPWNTQTGPTGDDHSNVIQAPHDVPLFNGTQTFAADASQQAPGGNYPSTGALAINLPTQESGAPNFGPPTNAGARWQCDALLRGARKALAEGDAKRAAIQLEQAKATGVAYGPMEDSPAKVEALLNRFNSLMAQQGQKDSEGYRHEYAGMLMEESKGLLAWREYDNAERLAGDAQNMGVQYNPVELHPDTLLQQIAAQRRGGSNAALAEIHPDAIPGGLATVAGGDDKPRAVELTRQARSALSSGDFKEAERLARMADGLARDAAFGPREDRPALVLFDIQNARVHSPSGVVAAGGVQAGDGNGVVVRSIYDPSQDPTRNIPASAMAQYPVVRAAADPNALQDPNAVQYPNPPQNPSPLQSVPSGDNAPQAVLLVRQGEKALIDGNRDEALRLFRLAYNMQDQLDQATRVRLQEHLQGLAYTPPRPAGSDGMLEGAVARQRVLANQISADISRTQASAKALQARDPKKGLEMLQQARARVASAPPELDPQWRQAFLRRVDASIQEMQAYIQKNLAKIELDQRNATVHREVDDRRNAKLEISEKLAAMVDDYNKAIDERRFMQAEVIAKRAAEMDPNNVVVHQMVTISKMLRREANNMAIKTEKEDAINEAFTDVDRSSTPMKGDPYQFGTTATKWAQMTDKRSRILAEGQTHRSPGDLDIEQKLTMPVSLKFKQAPLGEVLGYLEKMTQVNMFIDGQGLKAEGVSIDEPVTIDLSRDIQLKSALALLLTPLHLNYVIKNEVLNITSEDQKHGQVYTKSYPVADLVIPIPNFSPDGRQGINAALDEGYRRIGYGGAGGGAFGSAPMGAMAGEPKGGMMSQGVQAQVLPLGTGQIRSGTPQKSGYAGPGGAGGGSGADFDSLIELITSTVTPASWTDNGGAGSIAPFATNLTLVVSQTQEIHEQIADLLQQLRRLQDLQVTIEVRFITLDDDYFEKIGVDFNFNIPTNATNGTAVAFNGAAVSPSQVVGLAATSSATSGFTSTPAGAIQFNQNGIANANIPAFTGLTVDTTPASFGFAILSDIQAFFLVQALMGDDRSNVLQAPKVTLFNGQQAFVSDTSQEPFVTSVVPVVGDFAAAQEPVITVLSEGTSLTVQAVVSPDNRFVRLTVVPFFSQIGNVQTFQFTGSTSSTATSSNAANTTATSTSTAAGNTTVNTGTTVQLPTFNFVTVTTTVSVPDGGTVLLGGIKRLSEGRSERGVPILSDIPYINRLFRNTAVGRTTESLMMMVTPRIIIQEEEETKLLGTAVAP
jgi:general secretion pathway protein D